MSTLYSTLSEVYEAMYQSFINYDEEFNFYNKLLLPYKPKSVIEVGCGTGHLADRFTQSGIAYTGMDISLEMLAIAKSSNPECKFIEADMRGFWLPVKQDACIITGRTISYLITNEDLLNAFISINNNLGKEGVLCFDFIDAGKFIPAIAEGKEIMHEAVTGSKRYKRKSYWNIHYGENWTFSWDSFFMEENREGEFIEIGNDHSVIRTFTKDDITIFLALAGFDVVKIIDRETYAFDTKVVIAKKKSELLNTEEPWIYEDC